MKLHHAILILTIGAFASSCAPLDVAAPPVAKLTLPAAANLKKLEVGRAIYATACIRCHGPARIYRRKDEQWTDKILPKMSLMSALTPTQTDELRNYVMTARKALAEHPIP